MAKKNSRVSPDPWCEELERPGRSSLYGGAAREARLKEAGGIPAVIRMARMLREDVDQKIADRHAKELGANVTAFRRVRKVS